MKRKNNIGSIFKINSIILTWILLVACTLSNIVPANAKDKKPLKTRIGIVCTQLENNEIKLIATIKSKVEREYLKLSDAKLEFFSETDDTTILLRSGVTDKKGSAILEINTKDLKIREDGRYSILVSYEGDDAHKSSDKAVEFIPGYLDLKTVEGDSLNIISVTIIGQGDSTVSLEDIEVSIQIPRMFSNLTIANETTDENGIVKFDFPDDLPGGENGELRILAIAEDTDDYATLQSEVETNWGTLHPAYTKEDTRGLWTPDAPVWMVVAFAFLMGLVWFHFGVIGYKMIKIRNEGRIINKLSD